MIRTCHVLSVSARGDRSLRTAGIGLGANWPPPTLIVKWFLEVNKLPYIECHATLILNCPLCESQTDFINKTTTVQGVQ